MKKLLKITCFIFAFGLMLLSLVVIASAAQVTPQNTAINTTAAKVSPVSQAARRSSGEVEFPITHPVQVVTNSSANYGPGNPHQNNHDPTGYPNDTPCYADYHTKNSNRNADTYTDCSRSNRNRSCVSFTGCLFTHVLLSSGI
jgi:hypothetical protein